MVEKNNSHLLYNFVERNSSYQKALSPVKLFLDVERFFDQISTTIGNNQESTISNLDYVIIDRVHCETYQMV